MSLKTTNDSKESENRRKSVLIVKSNDYKNNYKLNRKPNDSRSDAITELELIYDKLNEQLLDSELLDRAERRDLPFIHQICWNHHNNDDNDYNNNYISHSEHPKVLQKDLKVKPNVFNNNINTNDRYESLNKRRSVATLEALEPLGNDNQRLRTDQLVRSRTPPYRRSAIPDIIRDDFAFRKYNKSLSHSQLCPKQEIKGFNSIKRINNNKHYSMSYLSMSSSIEDFYYDNQSIQTNDYDLKYLSKADVKVDDLSNRKLRQSSANNVLPPHPPFGIPNTVVNHSLVNDYIRAELDPKELSKVRFGKSKVPHLIHDDMAFRTLRKDYKSPMTTTLNTNSLPLPLPTVARRV